MIKYFCDLCGTEINDQNQPRGGDAPSRLGVEKVDPKNPGRMFQIEVITAINSCWDNGEFCKYCIIDMINEADDRPRSEK